MGQEFGLILSFPGNRQLWLVLDGKSWEYQVNAVVPQDSILCSLLLLYINDLPDDVICNIAIYADDLYSECDQAFDTWQQLEMAGELGASAAASEFYECVQVGIDLYIPHRKYQVKSQSSPWFSAACAASLQQIWLSGLLANS